MERHISGRSLALLIQGVIGLTWLRAGIEKLTDSHFVPGMGETLSAFASHNPHAWYCDFLMSVAIPHATAFGRLVECGETLTGAAMLAAAVMAVLATTRRGLVATNGLALAGLGAGILMSVNYWFATAWLAPADDTVNLLMAAVQVVLAAPALLALAGRRVKSAPSPTLDLTSSPA